MHLLTKYPIVSIVIGLVLIEIVELVALTVSAPLGIACRVIGTMMVVCSLFFTKHYPFKTTPLPYQLFIYWSVIVILRGSLIGNFKPGENPSLFNIINGLMTGGSAFAYLLPLVAILCYDMKMLSYLKKTSFIFSFVSLLLIVLMKDYFMSASFYLGDSGFSDTFGGTMTSRAFVTMLFPGFGLITFMAFTYEYIDDKIKFLLPLAILAYFFGEAIAAGRAQSVLSLGYLVSILYLSYKYGLNKTQTYKKTSGRKKKMVIVIVVCLFLSFIIYLYNTTEVFDLLMQRAFGGKGESSFAGSGREALSDAMIKDFNNNPIDWIVGRGINGSYIYNEYVEGESIGRRIYMEWGFLYMILKGGIVYLFLSTIILLRAVFLGLKRSNNLLCKAMAVMCFWQIIGLSCGISEPFMNARIAVVWMCVGCIENRKIRQLDDNTIRTYFNNRVQSKAIK